MAGYRIYYGAGEEPPNVIEVETNEVVLTDLVPGVIYYFYATAFNTAGLESEPSTTIFFDPLPKISPIKDVVISLMAPIVPIEFTVSDFDTPAGELNVSASSADELLLPSSNLLLEGITTNRILRIIPPLFPLDGEVLITISVSDGYSSAEESFLAQLILSGNTPPSVTSIADISIKEDEISPPLGFVLNDLETPVEELMVSVFSSDPAIISPASVIIEGDGTEKIFTITPEPDQSGATLITLEVFDGELAAQVSFEVQVEPVNDAPFVSQIENQQTVSGLSLGPLLWVIGDVETDPDLLEVSAQSSNLALVPNENIQIEGVGADRTVMVTPIEGQTGSATITLTVSDGETESSSSLEINVGPPPTLVIQQESTGEITLEVQGGFERDYRLEISPDLSTWVETGPIAPGEVWRDSFDDGQRFYRVVIP